MTDSYHAFFHLKTVPDRFVKTAIERCAECGFDTVKSSGANYIQEYETPDYEFGRDAEDPNDDYTGASPSVIATEISKAGEGAVTLWYDRMEFELLFHLQPDQEWYIPKLEMSFWRWNITPDDHRTHESTQARVNHFIDAIIALTTEFDPEFAYCDTLGILEQVFPEERPIADQIELLPWVTVLSEHLIEEFGGYERVLATPAWRVEKLKSGHVIIIKKDNPVSPTESSGRYPREYLLEEKDLEKIQSDK